MVTPSQAGTHGAGRSKPLLAPRLTGLPNGMSRTARSRAMVTPGVARREETRARENHNEWDQHERPVTAPDHQRGCASDDRHRTARGHRDSMGSAPGPTAPQAVLGPPAGLVELWHA